MKLADFCCIVCVAVTVVLVYQVVRQEMHRKLVINSLMGKSTRNKIQDEEVEALKKTQLGIKPKLKSLIVMNEWLRKKKDDLVRDKLVLEESIITCNKEQSEDDNKLSAATEALNKVKNEHNEGKANAQKNIQSLKQQILDRDKAICGLVDTTIAEAQKLCGLGNAQ